MRDERPSPDTALAAVAAFLNDGARVDGTPIPTGNPSECVQALAGSSLVDCVSTTSVPYELPMEPSPGAIHLGPEAALDPGANEALVPQPKSASPVLTCTVPFVADSEGRSFDITFTLSRAGTSRAPNCWLIDAVQTTLRCRTPNTG
jgi:hypothetical protein